MKTKNSMRCSIPDCKRVPCYDDAAWHMQLIKPVTHQPKAVGHTPTPWKTVRARTYVHIQDERRNCVASCAYEQAAANAAFIVRAVNMHEDLLGDLVILFQCFKSQMQPEMITLVERHLKQSLAKAEEEDI